MRSMPWDEDLWRKLKDAISPMPPFVRQRALRTIVEASEALAQERGSEVVEEEDLVKAAKQRHRLSPVSECSMTWLRWG